MVRYCTEFALIIIKIISDTLVFATIDANRTPDYPYVLASQYNGTVPAGSNSNVTIPTTDVTQYIAATLPVIIYQVTAFLILRLFIAECM